MSQLAAMLWRQAEEKMHAAEAVDRAGRPGPSRRRAVKLKRQAHAHLQESVALLEQVLQENTHFYLARLRLAYYLRHLQPTSALRHFRALVAHPEAGAAASDRHRVELARLLAEQKRPADALKVLGKAHPAGRCAALAAAAYFNFGRFDRAASALWEAALRPTAGKDADAKRTIRAVWPAVISMASAPGTLAQKWVRSGPAWWRSHTSSQIRTLAVKLMIMGRTRAGARVLAAASMPNRPPAAPTAASGCARHLARAAGHCLKRYAARFLTHPGSRGSLDLRLKCRAGWCGGRRCPLEAGLGRPELGPAARCICSALRACRASGPSTRCVYTVHTSLTIRVTPPHPR